MYGVEACTSPIEYPRSSQTLSPLPPSPDLIDITNAIQTEKEDWTDIVTQEIEAAIKHVTSNETPRSDEIPSEIFKHALPALREPLL